MSALLLSDLNGNASPLTRRSLSGSPTSGSPNASPSNCYTEHWLRNLLFRHPELLVLDRLGFEEIVPLCKELALPRAGTSVYADILGVTRLGRLAVMIAHNSLIGFSSLFQRQILQRRSSAANSS
jgi:hypothetical protein